MSCLAAPLLAQVAPAPASCSMGHCNPQMTDFVQQTPPGVNGSVYVASRDPWEGGVQAGDGCVANGTYAVCAYDQSWDALVAYDGNGNFIWGSGWLLDNQSYSGMPIIQSDGTVVAGDDQHIYKFNTNGTVAWSTPTPGGVPIGLVPTPNGAIVVGTAGRQVTQCWEDNCTLSFNVNAGGSGYTSASVILSGGYCQGAAATATVSNGAVTSVTATSQGPDCDTAPGVIISGNGHGAQVSAVLSAAAPVAVYSGTTGALVGSQFLYQSGTSGPYYVTLNTACVNNASYPNRVYFSTNLSSDKSQGALWAVDIDPTNLTSPISPAWSFTFHGPSGASPLCVGNNIYFDGAGVTPGDNVGTTIFGLTDNGSAPATLFHVSLGASSQNITCNFALDPRPEGGFWHQVRYDPNIYHRSFTDGSLIETVNVSNMLIANGAPQSTYWQAGVFTTYGSSTNPYLILPEAAYPGSGGYVAMLGLSTTSSPQLVWAIPLAGNDFTRYDTPGGDAVLVTNSAGNPVLVTAGKQTGAYFIVTGGALATLSTTSLSFGTQPVGSTSGPQSVTLTNSASLPIIVGNVIVSGPFSATNTCTSTLAPGTTCTIKVTFTPTASGSQTGSLTITSNSQTSPQTVALSGSGAVASSALTLSSNQLTFAGQSFGTISPPQSVTVTNTGAAGLTVASIVIGGAAAQTNNCPTNLAPSATCTMNVMLAAPLLGPCTGTITITTNDPAGPQSIALTGTCTALPSAESALSTSSLAFTPQTIGTVSASQSVTLSNIGTQSLSISSIAASGDVSEKTTCGKTLAVSATCSISVSFTPQATGQRTGTVTVNDSAPDSPHVISVSGRGMPNPVPAVNQPLVPTTVAPGTQGLSLTLNGNGFSAGSVVNWNGSPRPTTYVSDSQVTASLTASDLAAPATGGITVVNPSPGGGQSNTVWLPVTYLTPLPTLNTSTVQAGSGPAAVVTADFNRDGKLDLAVTNSIAGTVSIFLGNGDGTFAPNVDYPTGNQPAGLVVGDFNEDGIPDLAVTNQGDNTVAILLGSASGFSGATPYPTGVGPVAVVTADLNGDGNLDLAVANLSDNTVSILFGNGDGTFNAHLDYAADQSPRTLVAGDFNGDGWLDLAVGNDFTPGGTVTVLINHGDGSYLPGVAYATGDSTSVFAADLNGDGKLDLVAANELAQTMSVYLGNGNGTFTLGPFQTARLSPNPLGLSMADLNGDGSLEVVVASNSANGMLALQNENATSFLPVLQYGTGTGVAAVALGDFNNDGSIDMALPNPGTNQILILMQSPSATYSAATLNFGTTAVGGSSNQTLTLTNSGSGLLNVSSITAGGAFSQTNNCMSGIAPGSNCTITVTFTPTTATTQNGVLTIADNVPGGPQAITLTGTGSSVGVAVNLQGSSVLGGSSLTTNTVTLSSMAPAGGATVSLTSSNPAAASLPASVTVAAGATVSPAFTISTAPVPTSTPVTITASYFGTVGTAALTVTPIGVTFNLSQSGVYGGNSLTSNTLGLSNPAPAGGLVFSLSSSSPSIAMVPSSVSVAAGATASPSFTISSTPVASKTTVTLNAYLPGTTTAIGAISLTVYPAVLSSLTLSPSTITGGASSTANLVNLNGEAPAAGAVITLTNPRPNAANIPASVTAPANSSVSAPFTITGGYVTAVTQITVQATYLGKTVSATLTVNPDSVGSINLAASTVVGGSAATTTNTLTLLARAPSGGAVVTLSSNNPAVTVPASVTVAGGATVSPNFTITTAAVTTTTPVTISATYNGIVTSVTLTVVPVGLVSITLSHNGVTSGTQLGGNYVTLSGAAPKGGAVIALSSSNPSVASVPASVTVAQGYVKSPTFVITAGTVTTQTTVKISASYQGATVTAYFTVQP